MKESRTARNEHLISEEDLIEIRRAFHSLEAFQLSSEHREAKATLKARLAKGEPEKTEDKE